MIQEIHLENFLFMQQADLCFGKGLNVITGETGAGKSVLLEAVRLLLGKKARSGIVLPGKNSARVQATFNISTLTELKMLLEESGLNNDDDPDVLIISRSFKEDGSGKILINGMITTAGLIKQIGPYLMEIHGQNEHQTLLVPETQRKYLDRTGTDSFLQQLAELKVLYQKCQELQQRYLEIEQRQRHSAEKIQELQLILQELESLNLTDSEEEDKLKEDLQKLSHAETIINMLQSAVNALNGGDDNSGATSMSFKAAECLRRISAYDSRIARAEARAESIFHELRDLESELTDLAESTDLDPDRLYQVQARLSDISRTCRKYGRNFQQLFELHQQVKDQLSELYEPDSTREKVKKALEDIKRKFEIATDTVSQQRRKLAADLEKKVSREMQSLGFNSADFKVALTPATPGPNGAEQVEFMVSLNPGAPGGPLRKIASGGELSRVALAIKKVLAQSDELPTLLFDEIDAGIGGKTAEAVAGSLRALARQKQVLLVTHLHQIAKEGNLHFMVSKQVKQNQTAVEIRTVADDERVEEIARMLGQTDAEGLAFARTLLQRTCEAA